MKRIKISEEWKDALEKYVKHYLLITRGNGVTLFVINSVTITEERVSKKSLLGKKSKRVYYLEDMQTSCFYEGQVGTFTDDFATRLILYYLPSFIGECRKNFDSLKNQLSVFGLEISNKKKE